MSRHAQIPVWKSAPVVRLLASLLLGILVQWHFHCQLYVIVGLFSAIIFFYSLFYRLSLAKRFRFRWVQGILLQLLLFGLGLLACWQKDIRHQTSWYGHHYRQGDWLLVRIAEPPVEKSKSFKAEAYVEAVMHGDHPMTVEGKLLLYFSKDSIALRLQYGDRILLNSPLQEIRNSGNPGAFKYKQYAAFQQIFHQVYLKRKHWSVIHPPKENPLQKMIFSSRNGVLNILRKNIPDTDAAGIAEALLIGYTNDLDKDLVQAYSNTGVVHIIAISGMHLGLIYVMLVWLCSKIPGIRKSGWLQLVLILSSLWLFSFLTGASASVLRSAMMFTFIAFGKKIGRNASVYNSLAASAFIMLSYNPYYLWDVGFQLSYLAVVGIVVFQKPVYDLIYINNKWIDKVWKMMAVTLAAQVLTFPVCIYYFHQFPNLFLLTNLVAVPLSTVILFGEIFLVAFSLVPYVGLYAGKIVNAMIGLMNAFITKINALPYSVWEGLPATFSSTCMLYGVVIISAIWLMRRSKAAFISSLTFLLIWLLMLQTEGFRASLQRRIIVYNVGGYQAIDFIEGRKHCFIGSDTLLREGVLANFHLKPSRVALHLSERTEALPGLYRQHPFYQFGQCRILLVDRRWKFTPAAHPVNLDYIIISGNPKLNMEDLNKTFNCKVVVFDASNSLWKIGKWVKQCEALHLRWYKVAESGALVVDD